MTAIEKVLCINRASLPARWVAQRTVLPMDLAGFTGQCTQSGFSFVNRPEAEQDPGQKQIIPYILLQTEDGKQTAAYNRRGSETRLHDLWSVGIGGHINPIDRDNGGSSFKEILVTGMERELDEELIRRPAGDPVEFCGIISEDITPVGSVHLGAVFRILTNTPAAYLPGEELYRFTWTRTETLKTLNMELWSELALELVDRH
ncbi:MAG: phosphoesterase [Desulfobacterales bacterium]|nr:phosphoesterase [Desulfobacterales bacterium]